MNILEYENYHEEKTHVELKFPYNTYLCSIPLDFSGVPLHWHDEMEIIYVKKGSGQVTVDFSEYHVSAPCIVLILPGQLHSIEQYKDDSMEYENIIFSLSMLMLGNIDYAKDDFITPLILGKLTVPTLFTPVYPYYEDVIAPIDACDEICKTMPQGYQLYIKSKLYEFFYILDNRCRNLSRPIKSRKTLDKMKLVLKHVENNYAEKISVSDIAQIAGFSESHFMKFFKQHLHTTFTSYLNSYRLTIAARLLLTEDDSILSISERTGFNNLSYFNRLFKKEYQMSPREYRNR